MLCEKRGDCDDGGPPLLVITYALYYIFCTQSNNNNSRLRLRLRRRLLTLPLRPSCPRARFPNMGSALRQP